MCKGPPPHPFERSLYIISPASCSGLNSRSRRILAALLERKKTRCCCNRPTMVQVSAAVLL